MRKRSQRLWLIGASALLVAGAVALAATALKGSVAFFYGPTDLIEKDAVKAGANVRVGGLVAPGSVKYGEGGRLEFAITDRMNERRVVFSGLKPDLFNECEEIIAVGRFDGEGTLVADQLLAKHDEKYVPKEVYETMKARAEASTNKICPMAGAPA